MLPLTSKTRPTATGSSSMEKCVMACSILSSKTRKCSFSRPVTGRFSGSQTVTGTSTRLVSTRRLAPGTRVYSRLAGPLAGPGLHLAAVTAGYAKAAARSPLPARRIGASASYTGSPQSIVLRSSGGNVEFTSQRRGIRVKSKLSGGGSSQVADEPQSPSKLSRQYEQPSHALFSLVFPDSCRICGEASARGRALSGLRTLFAGTRAAGARSSSASVAGRHF